MRDDYFRTEQWLSYQRLMTERPEAFVDSELLRIITDQNEIQKFMEQTGRQIGVLYQSPFNILVVDLVKDKDERVFAYERLLPAVSEKAVVTVPHVGYRFILIKQFRHSIRKEQLAFPRGFGESGLSAEENAAKELHEEIGAKVIHTRILGNVTGDSGILGNEVVVVDAEIEAGELQTGEEGITKVCIYNKEELEQLITNNTITDGYTFSAWTMYCAQETAFCFSYTVFSL